MWQGRNTLMTGDRYSNITYTHKRHLQRGHSPRVEDSGKEGANKCTVIRLRHAYHRKALFFCSEAEDAEMWLGVAPLSYISGTPVKAIGGWPPEGS